MFGLEVLLATVESAQGPHDRPENVGLKNTLPGSRIEVENFTIRKDHGKEGGRHVIQMDSCQGVNRIATPSATPSTFYPKKIQQFLQQKAQCHHASKRRCMKASMQWLRKRKPGFHVENISSVFGI